MEGVGVFFMRVLTVMFFAGLAGCSVVVLLSWISLFKSELSSGRDSEAGYHPMAPPPRDHASASNRVDRAQTFSDSMQSSARQPLAR
jgi:hypothetical protein